MQGDEEGQAKRARRAQLAWARQVFCHGPGHAMGHFLDPVDFARLCVTSTSLREALRNCVRVRNNKLPAQQQLRRARCNFNVPRAVSELLKRERRRLPDLVVSGGEDPSSLGRTARTVVSFDLLSKRFRSLAPMITSRYNHATAVLPDGRMFVIGGYGLQGALSSVECLDLETGKFHLVASMKKPRSSAAAAVLGGKIYVTGGGARGYGGQVYASVECYDPATNHWNDVAPMSTPRCRHGVVTANNKIYALGGQVGSYNDVHLQSVECFDPATGPTGHWTAVAPMTIPRESFGVAAVGGKIYAMEGRNVEHRHAIRSVECLDVSEPGRQWCEVTPMMKPRYQFTAALADGKIYAIGGVGYNVRRLEYFNPEEGTWTLTDIIVPPEFLKLGSGVAVCQ